jgi:uncharacterized protein (DUF427 family)
MLAGQLIARSSSAYRVLETSHPPSWYIPTSDVSMQFIFPVRKQSFCEWKGAANYVTVRAGDALAEEAAWVYHSPNARFAAIKGYFAFYPNLLECFVDGERVEAQPGGFYGGWITRDIVGPFKGVPGSFGW